MIVTKEDHKLVIELDDEEDVTADHLLETRGSLYLTNALNAWMKGRMDTVREELRIALMKVDEFPTSIKELKEKLKDN